MIVGDVMHNGMCSRLLLSGHSVLIARNIILLACTDGFNVNSIRYVMLVIVIHLRVYPWACPLKPLNSAVTMISRMFSGVLFVDGPEKHGYMVQSQGTSFPVAKMA